MSRRTAIITITAISFLTFFIPFIFGFTLIAGDNFNQNVPLRALVGELLKSGHLPLWNTLSWSGTPLLAGFNAGAASPFTWIFALFSPSFSYIFVTSIAFALAGIGVLFLAVEIGSSPTAGLLGALAFELTGQFASQSVHMDMTQGITFIIWTAYFGLKVMTADEVSTALRYGVAMGVSFALVVVGGAPEAMLDGVFFLIFFLGVSLLSSDYKFRTLLIFVLGAAVALSLSGIQWIPGLAFQTSSTRATVGQSYFSAGPWSLLFLPLVFMPYSLGAFGGFVGLKVPYYIGSYNLAEVSTFLPSFVLFGGFANVLTRAYSSLVSKYRGALITTLVVGVVLALGPGIGPVESALAHVPLYRLQRLPSRNMFTVDLSLCLLFAGAFDLFAASSRWESIRTVLARNVVPVIASAFSVGFVVVLATSPSTVYSLVNANSSPSGTGYAYLISISSLEAAMVVIASFLFIKWSKRPSRALTRGLFVVVVLQIMEFSGITLIAQPGGYGPFQDPSTFYGKLSQIPSSYRIAAYDPHLKYYSQLLSLGLPDLNLLSNVSSVQGYSSLGLSSYTNYTDTKPQLDINPYLIDGYAHNYLNLDVLFTGSGYFLTKTPSTGSSLPSPTTIYSGKNPPAQTQCPSSTVSSAVYFGGVKAVSFISVSLPSSVPLSCLQSATLHGSSGTTNLSQITKQTSSHSVIFQAVTQVSSAYEVSFTSCGSLPLVNGAPKTPIELSTPYQLYSVNGILSQVVTPKLWSYHTGAYGVSEFWSNHPQTSAFKAPKNVSLSQVKSHLDGSASVKTTSPSPFTLVRSQAFAKDWRAVGVTPKGKSVSLTVQDYNALQSVKVPAGTYDIHFSYHPTSFIKGAAASSFGVLLAAGVLAYSFTLRRRRYTRSKTWNIHSNSSVRGRAGLKL